MKKLSLLLCAVILASAFAACGEKPNSGDKPNSKPSNAQSTQSSEPQPPPPPPYEPNVLNGMERDSTYPLGQRITAIMVNNISKCRPQRGLSQAEVIYEIMVEGGITRFMALFNDYTTLPDVGPVRSARDQHFRLILPFQPLYVHIGESVVQAQYIKDYNYQELNLDGDRGGLAYWDKERRAQGFDQEHTAYTNGELISEYIDNNDVDDSRDYNSTIFEFVPYDEEPRILENEGAENVDIRHSPSYRTYFKYDSSMQRYMMSQWNGSKKRVEDTVDENNGVQLSFDNVLVLFTEIYTYLGHEVKNLQYVEYNHGGVGYYFNGGRWERVRWLKGTPLEGLRIVDGDGNEIPVQINTGRTYVSFVSLNEYDYFKYYNNEAPIVSESIAPEANIKESDD